MNSETKRGTYGFGWILPTCVCALFAATAIVKHLGFPEGVVPALAILALAVVVILTARVYAWKQQSQRDVESQRFFAEVISNPEIAKHNPFYLFLRPFDITGKIQVAPMLETDAEQRLAADVSGMSDFETALGRVLPYPIRALGKPGEQIGAGRIQTDEARWKRDLAKLARLAAGILVIPANRSGTRWEIKQICKRPNLLYKTVFIMPPPEKRGWLGGGSDYDVQTEWNAAVVALRKIKIFLPKYSSSGMIFYVNTHGKVDACLPALDFTNPDQITSFMMARTVI